jgi:hypothetical protein
MQPETADAILASTQAGCPVPRFLGNKALTSTGDVSYTLGNNDHEDLDDAPGFALWLQRSAELERWQGTVDGWGLLFAWTSLMVRTPLPPRRLPSPYARCFRRLQLGILTSPLSLPLSRALCAAGWRSG